VDTIVHPITTVAVGFNRNIPNTTQLDRRLPQVYLQPKEQHLHGCEVNRIHTGGIMSPPSQHKTYHDLSDIKLTEFSQRTNFSFWSYVHYKDYQFYKLLSLKTPIANIVNTDY
jgi:hypothetical protein